MTAPKNKDIESCRGDWQRTDSRNKFSSVVKFPRLEKCFNCQSDLSDKRFCDVCKEISPSSSSSSVPVEGRYETFNFGFDDSLEKGMCLVDATSELLSYGPICYQSGQYFQLYPSPVNVIFKQPEEKVTSWLESSPSSAVDLVQVDSSISSDTLEDESSGCVTCGQVSDTCVMHVSSRHLDFCYKCATYFFKTGEHCPLCQDRIVYIYVYKDAYLV